MRLLLLAATGLLTVTAASAQVTLEKRYGTPVYPIKLSNGDVKYQADDRTTGQVTLYNANHSLFKQFTPPAAPAGHTLQYVDYVSDKLFNQDASLEYIASYMRFAQNQAGNSYTISIQRVYTETGTLITQIDSTDNYPYIFNTPAGARLRAHTVSPAEIQSAGTGNFVEGPDRIYALNGTLTEVRRTAVAADGAAPFPNPTEGRITLPYQVARGQQATLEVLDLSGRVVKRYTVDSTFDHLLLQGTELRPGAYTYRVSSAAGLMAGKKFVVSR